MKRLLENAYVYQDGHFVSKNRMDFPIAIAGEVFSEVPNGASVYILPGFVDVHVHLREPGFSYKETIASGTAAAAAGGYTAVCSMPNLNPVPDSLEHLQVQLDAIRRTACIPVLPFGAITVGEKGERLADLEAMAPFVAGFSDDGRGVQSSQVMQQAMEQARDLGKIISAHCEDNTLLHGGYIHDGAYARAHGHRGICSQSEWGPIARDLELCAKTGCAYHVCHISTKESVELIRQAKKSGLHVTCETGPHYLLLCDEDLQEDGRFKMNPPLRSPEDRDALLEGLLDGTVDMIATDHAPHSTQEKSQGLEKSLMGVVGLECAFPVLYTGLVEKGILSLEMLVEKMSLAPARRFSIDNGDSWTVFALGVDDTVRPERFRSMGRATPFAGFPVHARHLATVCGGKLVCPGEGQEERK